MESLFTSTTTQGRWIAESAYRAENLGVSKEFNIILPKDTTAERKLAVILDVICLNIAAHPRISACVSVPYIYISGNKRRHKSRMIPFDAAARCLRCITPTLKIKKTKNENCFFCRFWTNEPLSLMGMEQGCVQYISALGVITYSRWQLAHSQLGEAATTKEAKQCSATDRVSSKCF